MTYDRHDVPNDSWFTEEQLDHQRMLNIHRRFWQELGIDNLHRESPLWWSQVGRERYLAWANETHRCEQCQNLCTATELLDLLSDNQEGS